MAGIEPARSAWKAGVLPLNYIRKVIFNIYYVHLNNYSSDRVIVKSFFNPNHQNQFWGLPRLQRGKPQNWF